jgi:hypothetical protein
MANRMLGIALRTCTPRRWTSSGRRVSTSCTRFCVSICAMLRSVPIANVTVMVRLPSPGRLAVHVEHILDAVDLLFERRCDGAGDGLSGCAGIGYRDLHRRRDDFWILGDRKNRERAQTKRRHKDAEHGGEARAIDEENVLGACRGLGPSLGLRPRRNGSCRPVARLLPPVSRAECPR